MKMNRYLPVLLSVLLFASCKEDTGNFTLNFKAIYDGEPLVMLEELEYTDYEINILESDFYISNVSLIKGDEKIELARIDFVEFSSNNFNLERAEKGIDLSYLEVPEGTYDGLEFSIGVPPEENGMLPNAFESSNPLSNSGNYWSAWDSYIFAKLAGNYRGQEGNLSESWFFHTGTDALLRTFTVDKEIIIDASESSTVSITMEHKSLLQDGADYYDIENNSVNHDPTNLGPLEMIVNNYMSSFSFD